MRRRATTLLVVAATAATATLAALTSLPADRAEASHGCRASTSSGAKIFERSKFGVVFLKRNTFYGCIYSVGTVRRLPGGTDQSAFAQINFRSIKLDGRYVAYWNFDEEGAGDVGYSSLFVYDLKTGEIKVREEAAPETAQGHRVTAFVLKANGSVAWIGEAANGSEKEYFVQKIADEEGNGKQVLDRGANIDPQSLAKAYDGLSIYWRNGEGLKTAPLR